MMHLWLTAPYWRPSADLRLQVDNRGAYRQRLRARKAKCPRHFASPYIGYGKRMFLDVAKGRALALLMDLDEEGF